MTERKYYLDWLKVLAILVLVPGHVARIFDYLPFYIKQGEHLWAEMLIRFLDVWFMPLFFVIGGISAYYSIEKRGMRKFKIERVKRLLAPLAFALISTLPLLGYIAFRVHYSDESLSFLEYLPNFYTPDARDLQGYKGSFSPAHLWYLLYVFVFSVFSGPVFRRLRAGRLPAWVKRSPLIFAILCVMLGKLTLLPYPNPIYFLAFFWLGYAMCSPEMDFDLFRSFKRNPALIVVPAIVLMLVLLIARAYYLPGFGPTWVYLVLQPVYSANALLWVLLIMYAGSNIFTGTNTILQYLSEASLYVYIIHMLVAIFIAQFVIKEFPAPIAFAIITFATFAIVFLVYEIFVRRIAFLRFVFGLGPGKQDRT